MSKIVLPRAQSGTAKEVMILTDWRDTPQVRDLLI